MDMPHLSWARKLCVPVPGPDLIDRPRLLKRLEEGASHRLTIISAPAGFGKTTLVSAWAHGTGRCVAWLTLDESDNDLSRFLFGLIAAMEQRWPGVDQALVPIRLLPHSTPAEEVLARLIDTLAALPADFPGERVLILDEYDSITAEPVHRAVECLVERMPPTIHLMVLTRTAPPFALEHLRRQGELTEIRAADLRFTAEEVAHFLRQALGPALAAEHVRLLQQRTEGTVALLQLAVRSLRDGAEMPLITPGPGGSCRDGFGYAAKEGPFSESIPKLYSTSRPPLARWQPIAYLGAVAGQEVPPENSGTEQETVELSEKPQGSGGSRCLERGSPSFPGWSPNTFLGKVSQMLPDMVQDLYQRSACWYAQAGMVREAIRRALAAGNQEYALHQIEQNALSFMVLGELTTLAGWVQSVESQGSRNPWLSIFKAWIMSFIGPLDSIYPWLEEVEQSLPAVTCEEMARCLLGHVCLIRACIDLLRGNSHRARELSLRTLELWPAEEQIMRSITMFCYALACQEEGMLAETVGALADAQAMASAGGNPLLVVGAMAAQADVLVSLGKLRQAMEIYETALALASLRDGGQLLGVGKIHPKVAEILYEWDDLEGATGYARRGIELIGQGEWGEVLPTAYAMLMRLRLAQRILMYAEQVSAPAEQFALMYALSDAAVASLAATEARLWLARGRLEALVACYDVLLRVRLARGDLAGAEQIVLEAKQLIHSEDPSLATIMAFAAMQVRLWLAQGRLEQCAAWAEQVSAQLDSGFSHRPTLETRLLARVLISLGRSKEALSLIERLLREAESARQRGCEVELLVLKALALESVNALPEAQRVLRRALDAGQEGGFVRVFVDAGPPIEKLLSQIPLDCFALACYGGQLQSAFSLSATHQVADTALGLSSRTAPGSPSELVEPLSPRELEVLRLLAQGYSNRDIAFRLVVSLNTVKKHLSNIYGKMGVENRIQCIRKARELHLITEEMGSTPTVHQLYPSILL